MNNKCILKFAQVFRFTESITLYVLKQRARLFTRGYIDTSFKPWCDYHITFIANKNISDITSHSVTATPCLLRCCFFQDKNSRAFGKFGFSLVQLHRFQMYAEISNIILKLESKVFATIDKIKFFCHFTQFSSLLFQSQGASV